MAGKDEKVKVSIGILFSARELELDIVGDEDKIIERIEDAIGDPDQKVLNLTDSEGKTAILPVDKIAYCDVHPAKGSSIGFG